MQPLAYGKLEELEEFIQQIQTYEPLQYLLMIMGPKGGGKTTIFNLIIQPLNDQIYQYNNGYMEIVQPFAHIIKNIGQQSVIDLESIVEFSQKNAQTYFEQVSIIKSAQQCAILLVIRADRIEVEEISSYLRQIQHHFQLELDSLENCLDSVQLIITHYEHNLKNRMYIKLSQPQMQYFYDELRRKAIYFNKITSNDWRSLIISKLETKLRGQLKYSSLKQKGLNLELEKSCSNYLNSNFQVIIYELNSNLFNLILLLESTFNEQTKPYYQNLQKVLSDIQSFDQLHVFYQHLITWMSTFLPSLGGMMENFIPLPIEIINRITQLYHNISVHSEVNANLFQLQLFQSELQFLLQQEDSSFNLQQSQEILEILKLSLDKRQINYVPVILFGKSRVGKSTIANILIEQQLNCQRRLGRWVLESNNSLFGISHQNNNYTQDARSQNIDQGNLKFTIVDLPGYDMDHDRLQQFKNYLNISPLLKQRYLILIVAKHDIFESDNEINKLKESFQDFFQSSLEEKIQDIILITTRGDQDAQENLVQMLTPDNNQRIWLDIIADRFVNFQQVSANSYQNIIQQFRASLVGQIGRNLEIKQNVQDLPFIISDQRKKEYQKIITNISATIYFEVELFFIQFIRILSENCEYNYLEQQLKSLIMIIDKDPKKIIQNNKDYLIDLFAQLQQWIRNHSLDIQFSHRLAQKLVIGNCIEKIYFNIMPDNEEFIDFKNYVYFIRDMLKDLEKYGKIAKNTNILAARFQILANLASIGLCIVTFGGEAIASAVLAKGMIRLVGGVTTGKAVSSLIELTSSLENKSMRKHVQKLIDKIKLERGGQQ